MNKKSDKQKQKDYTLSKIKNGLIEKHGIKRSFINQK